MKKTHDFWKKTVAGEEPTKELDLDNQQEQSEKKEATRRKLTERFWQYADILADTTTIFEKNPEISFEELKAQLLGEKNKNRDFRIIDEFLKQLQSSRQKLTKFLEGTKAEAEKMSISEAEMLFYKATYNYNVGPIEYDIRNGFALVFFVQDAMDFYEFVSSDAGGVYILPRDLNAPPSLDNLSPFIYPVIAVKGSKPPEGEFLHRSNLVYKHELGHAYNDHFSRAVSKLYSDHKMVWRTFQSEKNLNIKDVVRQQDLSSTPDKNSGLYQQVLRYALARAKDELLAEMTSKPLGVARHAEALTGGFSGYDYFTNQFAIQKDSQWGQELYNDYNAIVKGSAEIAQEMSMGYARFRTPNTGTSKKLVWVLAQIPLELWPHVLKDRTTLYQDALQS